MAEANHRRVLKNNRQKSPQPSFAVIFICCFDFTACIHNGKFCTEVFTLTNPLLTKRGAFFLFLTPAPVSYQEAVLFGSVFYF